MRRLELLIKQSRLSTENTDLNGCTQDEYAEYFNNAQDIVQTMIQNVHPENELFSKEGYIDLVNDQDSYSMVNLDDISGNSFVANILATSAVSLVEITTDNEYYLPLKFISPKERESGWGYWFMDNNILISPKPASGKLRIMFTPRLPDVDIRRGKVDSLISGTSITLAAPKLSVAIADFDDIDYCTVVDKDGTIIRSNIVIDSFTSPTISTSDDLTGVTTDHYVLYGKCSTTHSELPSICEMMLMEYVNFRVAMRDSDKGWNGIGAITKAMQTQLTELFADIGNDTAHIPISTVDYLNY